jgi:DNA-binding transcriptional LysR family regulator
VSRLNPSTAWPTVDLREIHVFLTLAEELHYGRAAERLRVTPSRVSQVIRTLETKIGGRLFERTSRHVKLTMLGERFREQLEPAYAAVKLAIQTTQCEAGASAGRIRVGFTSTTEGPILSDLIRQFEACYPGCEVTLHETEVFDPYRALRQGKVDVLYNYLPIGEPDLVAGPTLERYNVRLAVARGHPLAGMSAVSIEDLADEETARLPPTFPAALHDTALPPFTPLGRPIRRSYPVRTIKEIVSLIAQGRIVWAVARRAYLGPDRDDIVTIPMRDVPALQVGLIWCATREDAHIRALAEIARELTTATDGPVAAPRAGANDAAQAPRPA